MLVGGHLGRAYLLPVPAVPLSTKRLQLSLAAFLCPGSSQSRDPGSTARQMAESLTARSGRSSEMRPDISSGDQCSSRMGLTTSDRLSGSSMSLGRLQASLLLSAFLCAAGARQRALQGPASRSA